MPKGNIAQELEYMVPMTVNTGANITPIITTGLGVVLAVCQSTVPTTAGVYAKGCMLIVVGTSTPYFNAAALADTANFDSIA